MILCLISTFCGHLFWIVRLLRKSISRFLGRLKCAEIGHIKVWMKAFGRLLVQIILRLGAELYFVFRNLQFDFTEGIQNFQTVLRCQLRVAIARFQSFQVWLALNLNFLMYGLICMSITSSLSYSLWPFKISQYFLGLHFCLIPAFLPIFAGIMNLRICEKSLRNWGVFILRLV